MINETRKKRATDPLSISDKPPIKLYDLRSVEKKLLNNIITDIKSIKYVEIKRFLPVTNVNCFIKFFSLTLLRRTKSLVLESTGGIAVYLPYTTIIRFVNNPINIESVAIA